MITQTIEEQLMICEIEAYLREFAEDIQKASADLELAIRELEEAMKTMLTLACEAKAALEGDSDKS